MEKIQSDYREFRGSSEQLSDSAEVIQLLESRYYDAMGNCIKKVGPDCQDLKTGQKLNGGRNLAGPERDGKTPFHTNLKQFPFHKMLVTELSKRLIIYHTGYKGDGADEALDDEMYVVGKIQPFAEKNHIELNEDSKEPVNGLYTFIDGKRTGDFGGGTDVEVWQECQKFFGVK